MGANVMMRIAGEMKSDFPLKAMVAVNNPFDIWLTIQLMRGKIYEKHLANELKRSLVVRNPVTDSEKAVYKEIIKKLGEGSKKNGFARLVTLSPLTPMATHFHIRNGAKQIHINEETQNFEY